MQGYGMDELGQQTIMILGGDGYLGWSLGLAFANRTSANVILLDNLVKRKWEKEVNAKLLVPLKHPKARVTAYKRLYGKSNLAFANVDLLDQKALCKAIKKYRPQVIINAAQQPSAPFSMMSPKNAAVTFSNNLVGHMNVLWAIAQIDKSITCIKLGSVGCYMDTNTTYLPLGRKNFNFTHRGKSHQVLDVFMPMQATDFYHQSKISDFLLDDLCAKLWNLKIVTVQQATIFGATIPENHAPEHAALSARFNYDAVFSTVLNRFACQLAIGHPLTVYGDGSQRTSLISLTDTVENFMRLAAMEVKPGQHKVVHNYTNNLSITEIAEKIQAADSSAVIKYIKNPRQEPTGQLSRKIQVHSAVKATHTDKNLKLEAELSRMIEFTKRYADNIDHAIIMPKIKWTVEETAQTQRHFIPKYINLPISRFRQQQYDKHLATD